MPPKNLASIGKIKQKVQKNLPKQIQYLGNICISSAKGAICNRGEGALCCPLDKDSDTETTTKASFKPFRTAILLSIEWFETGCITAKFFIIQIQK